MNAGKSSTTRSTIPNKGQFHTTPAAAPHTLVIIIAVLSALLVVAAVVITVLVFIVRRRRRRRDERTVTETELVMTVCRMKRKSKICETGLTTPVPGWRYGEASDKDEQEQRSKMAQRGQRRRCNKPEIEGQRTFVNVAHVGAGKSMAWSTAKLAALESRLTKSPKLAPSTTIGLKKAAQSIHVAANRDRVNDLLKTVKLENRADYEKRQPNKAVAPVESLQALQNDMQRQHLLKERRDIEDILKIQAGLDDKQDTAKETTKSKEQDDSTTKDTPPKESDDVDVVEKKRKHRKGKKKRR